MSMFLPEGPNQTSPPSGVAAITPADPETTQADIALMQRVLSAASRNPNLIPADFMSYMLDWIQTQRLQIPIGQVFGFQQFTANFATISGYGTTTSVTYGDLDGSVGGASPIPGPVLSGLADGKYVVLIGCAAYNSVNNGATLMSLQVNSTAALDTNSAECYANVPISIARAFTLSLSNGGSNTLTAKYKVSAGTTGTFSTCWMVALRYANL